MMSGLWDDVTVEGIEEFINSTNGRLPMTEVASFEYISQDWN